MIKMAIGSKRRVLVIAEVDMLGTTVQQHGIKITAAFERCLVNGIQMRDMLGVMLRERHRIYLVWGGAGA